MEALCLVAAYLIIREIVRYRRAIRDLRSQTD